MARQLATGCLWLWISSPYVVDLAKDPELSWIFCKIRYEMNIHNHLKKYWRANIRAVLILLAIWFAVGFGVSILFIKQVNQIRIGNLGLGFWFAQQGAIYVFILLVLIYALWMDRLDRKYDVGD